MIQREQIHELVRKINLPEFDPIDVGHLYAMARLAYEKGVNDAMDWKHFTGQRPSDGEKVLVWFNASEEGPAERDLMTYREGHDGHWRCESDKIFGEIFYPDLWCRIMPPGA
jgi:hypothetical protein